MVHIYGWSAGRGLGVRLREAELTRQSYSMLEVVRSSSWQGGRESEGGEEVNKRGEG